MIISVNSWEFRIRSQNSISSCNFVINGGKFFRIRDTYRVMYSAHNEKIKFQKSQKMIELQC